ncbi:MAG: hypothetical protein ACXWDN_10305 [Limisphaerales bacterium]
MYRAKNKIALIAGGVLVVVLITACVIYRTRTVSYAEFLRAAEPNLHATLISVSYYCGSEDGYDYFVVRQPLGTENRYRVSVSESKLTDRFPYTKDRSKWRELHILPNPSAAADGGLPLSLQSTSQWAAAAELVCSA